MNQVMEQMNPQKPTARQDLGRGENEIEHDDKLASAADSNLTKLTCPQPIDSDASSSTKCVTNAESSADYSPALASSPTTTLLWSTRGSKITKSKRPMCPRCYRPTPAACICDSLPQEPIVLRKTRVLILQHPQELKRKNRTVPLLQLALRSPNNSNSGASPCIQVAVARKLGAHVAFQQIIDDESQSLLLLYPGPDAISLEEAIQKLSLKQQQRQRHRPQSVDLLNEEAELTAHATPSEASPMSKADHVINLLVLDGTWKYTKEMDRANTYPNHIIRVQWGHKDIVALKPLQDNQGHSTIGGTTTTGRFASIRTPPSPNHLSTAECIALAVSRLEDGSDSAYLFEQLMKPLDCMVKKWNSYRNNKGNPEHIDEENKNNDNHQNPGSGNLLRDIGNGVMGYCHGLDSIMIDKGGSQGPSAKKQKVHVKIV